MAKNLLCTFFFTLLLFYCACACLEKNPCLCRVSENKKIDISNITRKDEFLTDSFGYLTFFYHGCTDVNFNPADFNITLPVNATNTCNRTSLCIYNQSSHSLLGVGKARESEFQLVPASTETWELLYKDVNDNKTEFTAIIKLGCVININNSYIKAESPGPSSKFKFVLFSPHSCVIQDAKNDDNSLSTGSVLLIMFFTTVGLYFIGGALVLHLLRGARGIEMIPNLDFWRGLPYLVRDGVAFLLNGCKPTLGSGAEVYDRI